MITFSFHRTKYSAFSELFFCYQIFFFLQFGICDCHFFFSFLSLPPFCLLYLQSHSIGIRFLNEFLLLILFFFSSFFCESLFISHCLYYRIGSYFFSISFHFNSYIFFLTTFIFVIHKLLSFVFQTYQIETLIPIRSLKLCNVKAGQYLHG